jgi:hypothetical protein
LKPERNIERRKITSKNKNPRYTLFVGEKEGKARTTTYTTPDLPPTNHQPRCPPAMAEREAGIWEEREGQSREATEGKSPQGQSPSKFKHFKFFEHFLNLNFF